MDRSDSKTSQSVDTGALEESLEALRNCLSEQKLPVAIEEMLARATELFAMHGAGLMCVDRDSVLTFAVATDPVATMLEREQEETGRGPCIDSLVQNRVVVVGDLSNDDRWALPRSVEAGVRGVLGVPVSLVVGPVGSLNVHSMEPIEWDDSQVDALAAYSELLGEWLAQSLEADRLSELADQLQTALDSRVVIERAVGYLMARDSLGSVDAFNRLRSQARSERRKVADLAAELLPDWGSASADRGASRTDRS